MERSDTGQLGYRLRRMSEADSEAIVAIFNHYVENSFAAYLDRPVEAAFFQKVRQPGYPALVVEAAGGEVVGFAFLRPYHFADTFKRAAEIVYFIGARHTRQGLGTALLERLTAEARAMGIDTLLASICSHNEPSLRFHERRGFVECGRLLRVGRKMGRDFDVVWMQRLL